MESLYTTLEELHPVLIQIVGSRIFGVSNPKDLDVLAIVKNKDKWTKEDRNKLFEETKIDLFVFSEEEYKKYTFSGDSNSLHMRNLCAWGNHELARQNYCDLVLYGEPPCKEISMFDHRDLALNRVLEIGKRNFFSPYVIRRNPENREQVCTKLMCWALWYTYVFENQSLDLTLDQQRTIQLCHDGKLPIMESENLEKRIENLLVKS